ncbi:MAG: DNA polymerase III subunit delta [Peptococcales bacterium]|jgi:DNA polymerase-3 subunit delta
MEHIALLKSINRGVLAPVYLFYGTEKLLMDDYVDKIKAKVLPSELEAFNFDKVDGEKVSLTQIVDLANTMPVLAEKRVVIVENAVYFAATKSGENKFNEAPLLKYLTNPNTSCCLIFKVLGKADKRKKIYKAVEERGQTVEFASLTGENLGRWIEHFLKEKGKKIEPQAFHIIALLASEGLAVLQNELEKLVLYSGNSTVITSAMVQDIVTKTSEINVFNLIDSIAEKKGKKALELLQLSLIMGESPMKILSLLVRQYRLIFAAKDMVSQGFSERQIREKLAIQPFVLAKVLSQGRSFSGEQLVKAFAKLLETEVLLKSSGGDPGELMENLVIGLCYM